MPYYSLSLHLSTCILMSDGVTGLVRESILQARESAARQVWQHPDKYDDRDTFALFSRLRFRSSTRGVDIGSIARSSSLTYVDDYKGLFSM